MKFPCLIASTLFVVFISQYSTNGLPIDDITTQRSCLKGFELVDGECQPILPLSEKSDVESNPTRLEKVTFSNEVTTEKTEEFGKSGSCPEGTILGENGLCEDIKFQDQPSTTLKPKKFDDTPVEHEKELLDHTSEPVENEGRPLDHTDEPVEDERKPLDHTSEPVEDDREPTDRKGKSGEQEREPSARKGGKSIDADVPKGCPPGTKADEQGACQDEVARTSTTLTMDLKDLLTKDGSCPPDMELFKEKCVYIKSKQPLEKTLMHDSANFEDDKIDREDKLVPLLKDGLCPQGTEYYSNGLCRVRTGPSTLKTLTENEKCQAGEILIDGKCTRKETKTIKTSDIASETKPSDKDEDKSVEH